MAGRPHLRPRWAPSSSWTEALSPRCTEAEQSCLQGLPAAQLWAPGQLRGAQGLLGEAACPLGGRRCPPGVPLWRGHHFEEWRGRCPWGRDVPWLRESFSASVPLRPKRGCLWIWRDSYWGEHELKTHVTTTALALLPLVMARADFPCSLLLLSSAQGVLMDGEALGRGSKAAVLEHHRWGG